MPKAVMTKQRFINQWLRHFARGVSKSDLQKYVIDQYIWHVFSCDLLSPGSFLEGEEARAAYDAMDKSSCIFCDMFGPRGVSYTVADEYKTAERIDSVTELYVVSKDFSWTYIKTHEDGLCGPYFMKI